MAAVGKLASQLSKLLSRKQIKFLGEQKDILATEPSAAMAEWEGTTVPSTLQLDEPTVMQHSTTLPEFEGHSTLDQNQLVDAASWWPAFQDEPSAVVPINEWDRPPIPEKLARKWKWQKIAHGVKQDDDRPAPLVEMKPFLDLRFRLDERFKLIDDVTNDIVSKNALINTLSNPQSEEVGQIFSFIGDNKTKPFLSRSQTKKYNRPWRNVDRPTTFLPSEEEILFDVKEFNLPANEILVEDGVLWKLQHDLHDLISDPKFHQIRMIGAGRDEEYYDKLESGIKILADVLKTPAFKKEVEIQRGEGVVLRKINELKEKWIRPEDRDLGLFPSDDAVKKLERALKDEEAMLAKGLTSDSSDSEYAEVLGALERERPELFSKQYKSNDPIEKSTRFYKRINIEDFVGIAKDKRKEEIRKNPEQISETFQWADDGEFELKGILQEGIVESPEISDELMFYSSLERDGFIQGGSQELIREGASLSFDPLLSFRKFAREDLDRMFYVDLPEDMSANDIVNLSSADYLIPEDKDGIILKPNVFNEKEIFVTKEGGFRSKLNVRRLDKDEKRELLRLNRAHTKAIVATDSLQEMRSRGWDISYYNRLHEGKYTPTTIAELPGKDRSRFGGFGASDSSIDLPPNQTAVEKIVDNFTFLHKQLTDPEEYISKIEAGDSAAATIKTLYSDIEAYEKQLQGNLIQISRHISDLTNQLRKLKANKSASLDIIKQLYFKTPTYQLVGDMVVMKKLKQRLVELTEISKQHEALSPKGIEALIGLPTNADNLRQKLKTPLKEALDPIFEKPLDGSELENFNSTQSILEEMDDPTFLKIYILNDILKMRASTRNKSKNFSYEVKNEYADKKRLSPSDVGKEHAERFKKANSSKLTKLWSDYTKANEVTLEFMLKNFGYAMGGVVDMRNGGVVGMKDGGSIWPEFNDAVAMLLKDVVGKNILGLPVSMIQTEENLNQSTIKVLQDLARKARKAGRWNIVHTDYGKDEQGAPISGIIGGQGEEEASKIYPKTLAGFLKLTKGVFTDPKLETIMTFGGASLHEDEEGNTILTDDYNAQKFLYGSASTGTYGPVRDEVQKWVTLEGKEGEAKEDTIKWRVNLGKIS